jgi:hypothetical protein
MRLRLVSVAVIRKNMLSYKKAKKLAETWIDLTTDEACEITLIEDKPYGWVFFYNSKDYDSNDISTHLAGNAPIIVDRIDGELRVTGTARPTEHYIQEYEATLPEARMQMIPERHDGAKKYS